MKNFLSKIASFCKTYKKRILVVIGSSILIIAAIVGITGGVIYSRAKSNIKYSKSQLEKIALEKIPGKVVDVKEKLNFKSESFQYEFKIKDKNNMLQEIKLDSKYGAILKYKSGNHNKQRKYGYGKQNFRRRKH